MPRRIIMGREAACTCIWAGIGAQVKALIEPPHLILRGGFRRRLPLAELRNVRADGDLLHFDFRQDSISLVLDNGLAAKWAQAITALPVTLAKKLGITPETCVRVLGIVDDDGLREALAVAQKASKNHGDLVLARVDVGRDVLRTLKATAPDLAAGKPIWFIYPKGSGHMMTEADLRAIVLPTGLVDTKVAAVSQRLTALRFVKRINPVSK
jgi:hypothetical protein